MDKEGPLRIHSFSGPLLAFGCITLPKASLDGDMVPMLQKKELRFLKRLVQSYTVQTGRIRIQTEASLSASPR